MSVPMIKTLTPELLDVIEDAADRAEAEVRHDYSGRAMYGEKCIGIVGSQRAIARALVYVAAGEPHLAEHMAEAMRTDSMGLDTIAYFPGIQAAGTETP